MNKTTVKPCSEWADKLAARHPDDLSPADAAALKRHLQTCAACASVYRSYALMEAAIRDLPVGEPLAVLPQQSLLEEPVKGHLADVATSEQTIFPRWPRATTRRKQVVRFANLAAAVLVVGAIIVASVLLFGSRHAPTTTGGNNTAQQPSTQVHFACTYYNDPGVNQACLDHYFVPINETKQMAGYAITLDSVYADGVRGVIMYHVVKLAGGIYGDGHFYGPHFSDPLSTQQGEAVASSGGFSGPVVLKAQPFTLEKGLRESAMFFDTTSFPATDNELHLRLDIATMFFMQFNTQSSGTTRINGSVTFDFSVPLHPARRIANLNQTITVNGQKVTLTRVVVGFSETLFYLNGINLNYNFFLLVGNWNRQIGGQVIGNIEKNNAIALTADLPLLAESGQWMLKFTGNGGTWTIHFTVPPAAG